MSSLVYTKVQNFLDPQNLREEGSAENYFSQQFELLLKKHNLDIDTLNTDQLREVVASLLQDVLLELKEKGA